MSINDNNDEQIFISYSHEDMNFTKKLVNTLRREGLKVWWDESGIIGGERLWRRIGESISKTKYFIPIVSPDYERSNAMEEYDMVYPKAAEGAVEIISVICKKGKLVGHLSVRVKSRRYIDFTEKDFDGAFKELLKSLIKKIAPQQAQEKEVIEVPKITEGEDEKAPVGETLIPIYFDPDSSSLKLEEELRTSFFADKQVDPKFLYWDADGTRRWFKLSKEYPFYKLYDISREILFEKCGEIYQIMAETWKGPFDYICLGVGSGEKDRCILEALLQGVQNPAEKIYYYPIDISFPMLQESYESLREFLNKYKNKIEVRCLNVDILKLHRYTGILRRSPNPKLIGFSGGSLGNFRENLVIKEILSLMKKGDYFLLGVDYIANKSNENLKKEYEGEDFRDIVFGPLCYLVDVNLAELRKSSTLVIDEYFSDVSTPPASFCKTISMLSKYRGSDVNLFFSTKYDRAALHDYLTKKRLRIIKEFLTKNNRYAEILLQL